MEIRCKFQETAHGHSLDTLKIANEVMMFPNPRPYSAPRWQQQKQKREQCEKSYLNWEIVGQNGCQGSRPPPKGEKRKRNHP